MAKVPDRGRSLEVIDKIRPPTIKDFFTTTNGIKFRLLKVSPFIIRELDKNMKPPKPPVLFNEDKERSEENPNDPDYLDAKQMFEQEKGMAAMNIYFGLGTKLDFLPEGLEPPESLDWAEFLIDHAIAVPPGGRSRYVAWLRYYALTNENDLNDLFMACLRLSGLATEAEVAEVTKSFRSDAERGADTESPVTAQG